MFCLFYPTYNWWKLAAANVSSLWTQLISSQFFPIHFSQSQGHQFSALGNSCTYPGASFVSTSVVWLHCHYDSSQLEHAPISHAWELEAEFAYVMGIIWSTNTYCSAKNTVVCFLTILNWFLNEILNTIKKFNTSISRKYFEYTYIFKTLFSRFSVMKSCWFWQPNEVIFSLSSTKMRKDYIAVYLNKVSSVLVLRFYLAVSRNLGLSDLKH